MTFSGTAAAVAPTVTTPTVSSIGTTSATLGANVTANGGASLTSRGTVWGTAASPTGNSSAEGGTTTGVFSHSRTGLTANTLYYYRGYAVNSAGTGYSADGTFTTLPLAPTVGSGSSATTSGFTANWSHPTMGSAAYTYTVEVDDDINFGSINATQSSIASGNTSQAIAGLSSATTYYFRVKAVNGQGSSSWSSTSAGVTTTAASGTLATSTGSLSALTATPYGTASGSANFTVTGSGLNSSGVTVTPPAGFEVSGTSDFASVGIAASPLSLGTSATLNTTVYVRLAATTVPGSYSGNISVAGGGASTQTVSIASSTVNTKALTITTPAVTTKTYDGNTSAVITGTLEGIVGSDAVTLSGTGTFASANAGTGISVTSTSTLGGADAANYSLTQPTGLAGTISAKALTITANNVTKAIGDTLTGGAGSTAFTSSGLVGIETIGSVTISYGSGAAANAAIGTYNGSVTPSAATGGTFTAANYSISYTAGNITVTGFTAGNLVVARYGDGTTTLASSATALAVVEINPSTGSTVQALNSVSTGANLLTDSGTATSDGYLNTYGTNLALPGYNTALGTASVASLNTKAVNVLGVGATVLGRVTFPTGGNSATPPSPFSTNNLRSAIATDTNKFYATGTSSGTPVTGGIWYYDGSAFTQVSTNPVSNTRNVEIFSGNLYFSCASGGNTGIFQVGTGLPTTTGQTASSTGITTTSPYGFAISPDGNTAYVADDSAVSGNTGGGIQKWTKSGGTWTRQYTFSPAARGLTVDFSAANPVIYATTTETSNNKIIKIVDTGSSATVADVAVAGANYVFRGVDFAPAATPTISTSGTLSAVSTTYGSASSSTQLSVSGANMTAGILVTPPSGFEVSTDNSTFSATVTVGSSGTISSTPVYVRLAATASVGSKSGNITLTSTGAADVNVATVTSTVSQKGVTISGLTGINKIYDGGTTATTSGTASYSGLVNGESYSVLGTPAASFANSSVGTNKVVTITGYLAPTANYTLTADPTTTADITAKGLTGSFTAADKSYDGTTAATVTGRSVSGKVVGDDVSLSGGTATFDSASAGNGKTVTLAGASLAGTAAGNYSLTSVSTTTADITAAALPAVTWSNGVISSAGGVSSFSYTYGGRNTNGVNTSYSSVSAPTAAGFYTVVATSTDGNYTGSTTNNYYVAGPVAVADAATKPAGNPPMTLTLASLLANDVRITAAGAVATDGLSITAVSGGSGNSAQIDGGDVLFTPGNASPEAFTYTLSYGGQTATGTVTVTTEAVAPSFFLQIVKVGTAVYSAGSTTMTNDFIGVPNQIYAVEYSTDLTNWTSAGDQSTGSTGSFSVTLSQAGDMASAWNSGMFFRAKVNP